MTKNDKKYWIYETNNFIPKKFFNEFWLIDHEIKEFEGKKVRMTIEERE